jgi:hypothetical protein
MDAETEEEALRGELYATLKLLKAAETELAALRARRCDECSWWRRESASWGTCDHVYVINGPMVVHEDDQQLHTKTDFGGCAAHEPKEAKRE